MLETKRLFIREMVQSDLDALCTILCDEEVMQIAYGHAFTVEEAQQWLNRNLKRYEDYGFGLWAVICKETNEMIGQCGLTMQQWRGQGILEIGFSFQKAYWHQGYAIESALACKEYAFSALNADRVYAIIRDINISSQKVAIRTGMQMIDQDSKNFRNIDMELLVYAVERTKELNQNRSLILPISSDLNIQLTSLNFSKHEQDYHLINLENSKAEQ